MNERDSDLRKRAAPIADPLPTLPTTEQPVCEGFETPLFRQMSEIPVRSPAPQHSSRAFDHASEKRRRKSFDDRSVVYPHGVHCFGHATAPFHERWRPCSPQRSVSYHEGSWIGPVCQCVLEGCRGSEDARRCDSVRSHRNGGGEAPVNRNGEQFAFVSKMTNCVFPLGGDRTKSRGLPLNLSSTPAQTTDGAGLSLIRPPDVDSQDGAFRCHYAIARDYWL